MPSLPSPAMRILIVEDHEESLRALSRLLSSEGHSVAEARSVGDALGHAADNKIDLLVSDIGLPDGDGCALLRRLIAMYHRHVPAIALTGHDEDHYLDECRSAGYSQFLLKPVVFDQLIAAVKMVTPVGAPDGEVQAAPAN